VNTKKRADGVTLISENRRARFDFAVSETFEAGMLLVGAEVKSLRNKAVSFTDAYAIVKDGEVLLIGLKIDAFRNASHAKPEPDRPRKLLLNKSEIEQMEVAVREKGETIVPLKLYFKGPWAKVQLGIAKGKTHRDRRDDIKKREADREVARVMRRGG
jgi:SsrA-binding protein